MTFSRVKPAPWMWTPNRVDPRAHWMLEDLMIAVPLWRAGVVDYLSPARGNTQMASAFVPTNHANVVTRTGRAFEKTGTDVDTINMQDPLKNATPLPSTELTAAVCLTTGAGSASATRVYWRKNAVTNESFQINQESTTTRTFRGRVQNSSSVLYTTVSTAAIASGLRVMAVLRVKAGETVTLNLYDMDTRVLIETVANVGNFAGVLTWSTAQYNLAALQHQYECAYAWKRKMDDTEVQRLVADPFGLFRQRTRTALTEPPAGVVVAAAGAGQDTAITY